MFNLRSVKNYIGTNTKEPSPCVLKESVLMKKDYYNLFIDLCLKRCLDDDYEDKSRVRANNSAMDKLLKLQKEMKETDCSKILDRLLLHDDRVRLSAGTFGVDFPSHREKSIIVINDVAKNSKDKMLSFDAYMVLGVKGLREEAQSGTQGDGSSVLD